MGVFDPPDGDYGGLNSAATVLGTVSTDLGSDLGATTGAVQTAVGAWKGSRMDDFARAGAGTQVQLKVAGDGCSSVSSLVGQYATAFRQACSDIAEYKRLSDSALSDAVTQSKTIDPSSTQYDSVFQNAAKRSSQFATEAMTTKNNLAKLAVHIAAQIDAETDKVAPVSSGLTPDQIRRQVDSELGLTGLSGSAATTPDQAWTLVGGAGRAIPPAAVNGDGSVNWTLAFAMPSVPAAGTDPKTVNDWWNGLSPTEQDALLNGLAGPVGNLDGIPVIDRDFANRLNLPVLTAGIQSQLDALGPEPTEYSGPAYGRFGPIPGAQTQAWRDWKAKHDALQSTLDGLNAVASALTKTSPAPLYLIGLQDTGNGRGIIATGNPDTATNVATYVPGMNTKLTGIGGGVDRANAMFGAATLAGATIPAVITWYGYDAPQGLKSAASEDDAKAAAPLLDSFQTGLRLTHEGAPSLNTVVAHSYGTTVTGYAASHGHTLDADNIVFVASPGTSVDHAGDLSLTGVPSDENGQHVFATVAEYDPIRLAAGINGPDPTGSDYGAHDFKSDADRGHLWLLGWNSSAHSSYWNSDNPSLRNMGLVIAGEGGQTK